MPSTPILPASPSACAGLRRALLQEGRTGFPIEPSPFQALVRRHGGSPRELLLHCQALRAEGAVTGLCPRWRPGLASAAVRLLAYRPEPPAHPALPTQPPDGLPALPGAMAWAVVEGPSAGPAADWRPPWGWVDLVAIDASAADQQAQAVQRMVPTLDWTAWSTVSAGREPADAGSAPCRCGRGEGPCQAPSLAAACERGLPLLAHPYRAVGRELGLSERQVVQALRRWRSSGQLLGVGFAEPVHAGAVLEWHAAYGVAALEPALLDALAGHASVERLVAASAVAAPAAGMAVLAQLVAPGSATPARLAEQLSHAGLGRGLLGVMRVRCTRLRQEPMLFVPVEPAAAGA